MLSYDKACIILVFFFLLIRRGEPRCELHALRSAAYDILNIRSDTGPLIFTYNKQKPEIRFPIVSRNALCILFSSDDNERPDIRLHLACPGQSLRIKTKSSTHELSISNTFLTTIDGFKFNIHRFGELNYSTSSSISCTNKPVHVMDQVNEVNEDKIYYYSVGFAINVVHFLPVYRLFRSLKLKSHVYGYVRVVSIIEERPKFNVLSEYKIGKIYEDKNINFTLAYQREFQIELFKSLLDENNKFVEIYFSDGNYLDKVNLINKDDLFYNAQQMSTYYYENTIPIWDSINKGNWDLVNKIARNLADETVTDMEVFTLPLNDLLVDKIKVCLSSVKLEECIGTNVYIRVPRLLVKIIYSSLNSTQGVVFHTANDPYITEKEMNDLIYNPRQPENGLCKKLGHCRDEYPQFLDAKKGLTYCCALEDSKVFRELKETYQEMIVL